MPGFRDGTIMQAGLQCQPDDYEHEHISHPVLGVVLDVYLSDDKANTSAARAQDLRGSHIEARVLVINDGFDSPWIIPNVVILPTCSSGYDDYYEDLPRPTNGTVDGSNFDPSLKGISPYKLNGDFCVVAFLGGSSHQPIMTHWFPHPANKQDPITSNIHEIGVLAQNRRLARRFKGTKLTVTSKGSIYLDTSQANSIKGNFGDKIALDDGGDIEISVKDTRHLEVNFNEPVPRLDEPDILQDNPIKARKVRNDTATKLFLDKDFIRAVAGSVVQLIGLGGAEIEGEQTPTDLILLGATPTDHAILGEKFQTTYNNLIAKYNDLVTKYNEFVTLYNTHGHIDGSGLPTSIPTSTPAPNPAFNTSLPPGPENQPFLQTPDDPAQEAEEAEEMPNSDLSAIIKLQ